MREAIELISESEVSHRMVDSAIGELRSVNAAPATANYADLRACIQDELFGLLAHLHFADICARDLDYAAERIAEMRRWVDLFDKGAADLPR